MGVVGVFQPYMYVFLLEGILIQVEKRLSDVMLSHWGFAIHNFSDAVNDIGTCIVFLQ